MSPEIMFRDQKGVPKSELWKVPLELLCEQNHQNLGLNLSQYPFDFSHYYLPKALYSRSNLQIDFFR